jgi:hypothetical protein
MNACTPLELCRNCSQVGGQGICLATREGVGLSEWGVLAGGVLEELEGEVTVGEVGEGEVTGWAAAASASSLVGVGLAVSLKKSSTTLMEENEEVGVGLGEGEGEEVAFWRVERWSMKRERSHDSEELRTVMGVCPWCSLRYCKLKTRLSQSFPNEGGKEGVSVST